MAKAKTGMAFERIAGRMADGVAYGHHGGTALRATPTYRYPVRPATAQGNARMKGANAVWNTLGAGEADAWTAYGERHPRRDPMSGVLYAPSGKNLFVGLGCKLLQLDPEASLPRLPPKGSYAGDRTTVAVALAPTGLVFAASAPNAEGTVTELMVQRLKNERCKPVTFYKSHGFVAFAEGGLEALVPLPPGAYACAVQSVERSTGRTAAWTPLGKVTVE